MKYNILVTAIGSFAAPEVIKSLQKDSRVQNIYGSDIFPAEWHWISKHLTNVFLAPPVSEEKLFLEFVSEVIEDFSIDIIIPLTDVEVDFFNKKRGFFKDVVISIGSDYFISIARNKEKLNKVLQKNNFPSVPSFTLEEVKKLNGPIIGKPKNGRSSEGLIFLEKGSKLNHHAKNFSNYVFQKYLAGDLFTVDIIHDIKTKEIILIPRKELIRTKNGAGITVELIKDKKLTDLASEISKIVNAQGAFNMEFIKSGHTYYLIDLNPRFSAGIGFSALTGYDLTKNMLNLLLNQPLESLGNYKNLIAQKKMSEVVNTILE